MCELLSFHNTCKHSIHTTSNTVFSCTVMSERRVRYLLELFLGLLLHPPDVVHGQTHPSVDPAEQLAVEVGENTLFLL